MRYLVTTFLVLLFTIPANAGTMYCKAGGYKYMIIPGKDTKTTVMDKCGEPVRTYYPSSSISVGAGKSTFKKGKDRVVRGRHKSATITADIEHWVYRIGRYYYTLEFVGGVLGGFAKSKVRRKY